MFNRGSKRSAKRTVTAKTAKAPGKYRPQVIEALESRQLLTTLYGGGTGRLAIYNLAADGATGSNMQIAIYGNVTAEFIFMHGPTGEIVNRDVTIVNTGATAPNSVSLRGTIGLNFFSDQPTNAVGSDIFAIYVSQSDINSYIAISQRDPTTGALTTFGSAQGFDINAANPKPTTAVTAPSGAGGLVLGAQTGGTFNAPIIKADINGAAFGVRPAGLDDLPDDPNNDLSAGLHVANGHDLGKFLFDGEVYGRVHVDGSMNMFYAGWLLTGDARGASQPGSPATGGFSGVSGLPVSLDDNFITAEDQALGANGHIVPRQNFFIGGDIQNLVSVGPIGWDGTFGTGRDNVGPFYLTGVDIYVRGRIGQIQASGGNTATVTALNLDPAAAGFVRPVVYQEELEGWTHFTSSGVVGSINGFPNTPAMDFSGGVLRRFAIGRDPVPIQTDTFNSFQMLAPFDSPNGKDIIDVLGSLFPNAGDGDEDVVDYYGVALLAGQKVRLVVRSGGNAHLGVFDPDGRLVASDYNNMSTPVSGTAELSAYTYEIPLEFTADRPGIYRIAIGERGDADFAGTPNLLSPEMYELIITNVGTMAIGGIMVAQQDSGPLDDATPTRMVDVFPGQHQVTAGNGDFGGLWGGQFNTGGTRLYVPTAPPAPGTINSNIQFGSMYVPAGSLRALDVTILGVGTPSSQTVGVGIDLNVAGNVGLVQTRDAGGIMELNPSLQASFGSSFFGGSSGGSSGGSFGGAAAASPTSPVPFTPAALSIGGNYQVINALSRFTGGVYTKKGMGILRAAAISGANRTDIYLDTDNVGFDGKSDLIDIAGSIDGPILRHGTGGNFRYFRVGGAISVDPQFGSSDFLHVVHDYGQSVMFTDDSGSTITVTPVGPRIANPAFDPLNPAAGPQFFLPQLSTLSYPVRSGGVIVMDVQSTGSLAVNGQAGASNGTAEISRIEVHGTGVAPVRTTRFTANNGYQTTLAPAFTSQALQNELSVVIGGSAITDVAYIVGLTPEPNNNFFTNTAATSGQAPPLRSVVSAFSNLTLVQNNTGGEILTVQAATLGTIRSTGTIGITRTTSIAGNSLNFIAPIAVGTAYAGRSATDVTADMPVNPTGNVVGNAYPFNGQTYGIAIGGDIAEVISNRGLGNIISTGIIGTVVANADGKNSGGEPEGINAPIVALGATTTTPPGPTGVSNGSILSVNIGQGMGSAGSGDFARTGIFAGNAIGSIFGNNADIRGTIVYGQTLGSLTLNGSGSLIDANILQFLDSNWAASRESGGTSAVLFLSNGGAFRNVGSININGGGGIIGTLIAGSNFGSINVPKGFGIISSQIMTAFGTNTLNSITAGGYGIRDTIISVGNNLAVVNVTGNGKNLSTNQVVASVRQSEIVRADPVLGFGFDPYSGRAFMPINDIHAALGTSQAAPVIAGVTDTGVLENTQISSQRSLGKITAQTIRGDLDPASGRPLMRINAGNSIDTIQTRGVINGLQLTTGRIKNFRPASNVGNLFLSISGSLDNLTIKGNLDKGSVIEASGPNGRIGNVTIKKNLNGTIHAAQSIGTVTIGGNLNGSLQVDGLAKNSMGLKKLQVGGTIANGALDVGTSGVIVNVGQIIVGKSLGANSSDSLHVSGTLDKLQVGGTLAASVNVGRGINTIQAQRIDGPVHAGGDIKNLIVKKGGLRGDVTVGNKLQNATVAGGISGNVSANNGIGTITVNGNVAPGKTIRTDFGQIGTLRVSGDLDASVISAGKIGQILVGHNVGNGTTPLTISAPRLGLLQVGGSIRNGVTIDINGPIDSLVVGKNIEDGAVVRASAITKHQIKGEVFGSLEIG